MRQGQLGRVYSTSERDENRYDLQQATSPGQCCSRLSPDFFQDSRLLITTRERRERDYGRRGVFPAAIR